MYFRRHSQWDYLVSSGGLIAERICPNRRLRSIASRFQWSRSRSNLSYFSCEMLLLRSLRTSTARSIASMGSSPRVGCLAVVLWTLPMWIPTPCDVGKTMRQRLQPNLIISVPSVSLEKRSLDWLGKKPPKGLGTSSLAIRDSPDKENSLLGVSSCGTGCIVMFSDTWFVVSISFFLVGGFGLYANNLHVKPVVVR